MLVLIAIDSGKDGIDPADADMEPSVRADRLPSKTEDEFSERVFPEG